MATPSQQGDSALCPSAPAQAGALLLGRFSEQGTLSFANGNLRIDENFLSAAEEAGVIPEQQYRFSSPCLKRGCAQWAEGRCGIAGALSQHFQPKADAQDLRPCPIRKECRWFAQEGPSICAVCPKVATLQPAIDSLAHPA